MHAAFSQLSQSDFLQSFFAESPDRVQTNTCVDHDRTNEFSTKPVSFPSNAMSVRRRGISWLFSFMRNGARELICRSSRHDLVIWTSGTIGLGKQLNQSTGNVKHTVTNDLMFITCGTDVWDVKHFHLQRLEHCFSCSDAGRLVVLAGRNGSTYPVEVRSMRQAATATASGDAEAIEWSLAVKAGIGIAEMLEFRRISQLQILGRPDNDSSWLSNAGRSMTFGSLRKTAEVNFKFLKVTQIPSGKSGHR